MKEQSNKPIHQWILGLWKRLYFISLRKSMGFSANDADAISFPQKEEREGGRKDGFLPQTLHENHYLVDYKLKMNDPLKVLE